MQNRDEPKERRSFLKGMLAGSLALAGLASGTRKGRASQAEEGKAHSDEVLYRETEEFRRYYQSLRD